MYQQTLTCCDCFCTNRLRFVGTIFSKILNLMAVVGTQARMIEFYLFLILHPRCVLSILMNISKNKREKYNILSQ